MDAKSVDRVPPRELWTLPHRLIQAFLDGYTAADGHRLKRASDPALNYKAANRALIEGVRNLHMILGHNVTRVREMKRTRQIVIRGKEVKNARSLWTFEAYETGVKVGRLASALLNNQGIAELFPEDSHFAPQRVLAIEPMEVEDTYDITVDDTHNFVAEGLVVHNSGFTQAIYKHYGIDAPRSSEAQGAWVKKITDPQSGGLAFYHSPAGGADPGHVAIIQNGSSVISQGGGMGPQIMGLHGMPLLSMGVPPGGFGSAGGGTTAGSMSASAISALWTSMGGPASAAANMAQIAFAESGDDPSIVQKGEPPGLTGYGLYQITPTSGISQNGAYGNLLNASNNTKAAIALFRGAGNSYSPWSSDPIGAGLSGGGGSTNAGSGNPGGSQYSYAGGGVIPEPVVGYGTRSGRSYSFGENGPETVVPGVASGSSTQGGGSSGGGNVINFNWYGPQMPSPEQQQALFMKASAMIGVS
jgi:hypothetical protein